VELLEELNSDGITLVVITHNPEIAARFPRQVALRDGMIETDSALAGAAR
jgi:putative ABC transport system ATP-binding protein